MLNEETKEKSNRRMYGNIRKKMAVLEGGEKCYKGKEQRRRVIKDRNMKLVRNKC